MNYSILFPLSFCIFPFLLLSLLLFVSYTLFSLFSLLHLNRKLSGVVVFPFSSWAHGMRYYGLRRPTTMEETCGSTTTTSTKPMTMAWSQVTIPASRFGDRVLTCFLIHLCPESRLRLVGVLESSHTDTDTDRQTDRQAGTITDRQTDRQADTVTDRQTDRPTD